MPDTFPHQSKFRTAVSTRVGKGQGRPLESGDPLSSFVFPSQHILPVQNIMYFILHALQFVILLHLDIFIN